MKWIKDVMDTWCLSRANVKNVEGERVPPWGWDYWEDLGRGPFPRAWCFICVRELSTDPSREWPGVEILII